MRIGGHYGRATTVGLVAVVSLACLQAADNAEPILFGRIEAKALENITKFPRYMCVETIEREEYQLPIAGPSCADAIAAKESNGAASRRLTWHDRLRLDVAVGRTSEMYSWAGATNFEDTDITKLVPPGASGSGEFGAFLTDVFEGAAEGFAYQGLNDTPSGSLARFAFHVPLSRSHYRYSTDSDVYTTLGYRGDFLAEQESGDLRELNIEVSDFPATDHVCRVNDSIEYQRTKIGQAEFVLPSASTMDVIHRNSIETVNATKFSGCREYVGESTLRFDGDENGKPKGAADSPAMRPLPPKTRLRVTINPPIDSATAAAGDPVTGEIRNQVKEKADILVRPGDKLHGRIVRLEQTMGAKPRWLVAILFETIERRGVEQKISLRAMDDGDRTPTTLDAPNAVGMSSGGMFTPAVALDSLSTQRPAAALDSLGTQRPAGGGAYSFAVSGNLVLGAKFESEWEVK